VRVNNFIQGAPGKGRIANSHSPSGLAAGNSKDSQDSEIFKPTKGKKGIKVVKPGKSPYIDGHFTHHQGGVVT